MSVAKERDWAHESHRALKNAAKRLADEREDPLIEADFAIAEKFQVYLHHGHPWKIGNAMLIAH